MGATEKKIFMEDEHTPEEKYYKISDEMWFATSLWIQNNAMWFAPNISEKLIFELTTRKQAKNPTNGRIKVESKDDYKSRNQGRSPDFADSAVQLQQLIRERFREIPSMSPDYQEKIDDDSNEYGGNITQSVYESDSLDLTTDNEEEEEDDNEFHWS
jgi:hypothetical protein